MDRFHTNSKFHAIRILYFLGLTIIGKQCSLGVHVYELSIQSLDNYVILCPRFHAHNMFILKHCDH